MTFNTFSSHRKWIGVVVFLCMLASLSVSVAVGQSDVQGELTFYWYEDRFADTMREYIDQFQQAHPGTTVNLEILPFSTYFERLPVQISTGDAPDIFFLVSGQVQNYAATGSLMDLSTCVPEDELPLFRTAQIDFSTYNDQLIALPFTTTVLTMLVNKNMFDASGIEIPQTIEDAWTQEEFADIMRQLKTDNPGLVSVLANGGRDFWWLPWFYGNGASLLNDALDAPAFNSPEAIATFEYLRGLTEEGLIAPPPTAGASAQEVQQLFVQGRQAIYSGGHWDMAGLTEAIGDGFTMSATLFPVGSGASSLALGGDYLVVSKDTENPELACSFLNFLTSQDITQDYASRYFYLPPRIDAEPVYEQHADIMALMNTEANDLASSTLTLHRGLPYYAAINSVFGAEYQLVMTGEHTPQQAVEAIDAATADALAQQAGS
ncbi:MAG: sugar ABC transporter substrate-binding protein [Anaerolineae bacterium]|nr:sugar ABC transporter substrate-binding protein [Anaerolineae bacterium]